MWFYSIQGVFRVAFEMYSKQEQLSVLENFQVTFQTPSYITNPPIEATTYNFNVT